VSGGGVHLLAQIVGTHIENELAVASTLLSESFASCVPFFQPLGQYITQGGSPESELKKLKGARFTTPSGLMVLIQPIGLGTTNAL
jgi:hypothetical protein